MSNIQVNTTPQALYPDGLQDSFTLTNNGPWTVYLDSDSSISTQSLALPPTATIAWDAKRPLWCLAAGDGSSLSVNRNSNASDAGRAVVYQPIVTTRNVVTTVGNTHNISNGEFECASYASLVVDMSADLFGTLSSTEEQIFRFYWRTRESVTLFSETYRVSQFLTSTGQITVPVKGDRCSIEVENQLSGNNVMSTTIYGTARVLAEKVDTLRHVTGNESIAAYVNPAAYGTSVESRKYVQFHDWLKVNPVYVNGLGRKLVVALQVTNSVTTAGVLLLRDMFSNDQIAELTVPVVTGSNRIRSVIAIPVSTQIAVVGATWVTTGIDNLSLYWEDDE